MEKVWDKSDKPWVQSLNDKILNFINRSHNKSTAISSIKKFLNISIIFSIDLIYGIPNNKFNKLENDINEIIKLGLTYFSILFNH